MILALALCLLGAAPAVQADDAVPADLNALVARYGVADVPADLVVVIDTSGSMTIDGNPPPWPSVQGAWNALLDTVGPNDRVALITFSDATARRWSLANPVTTEEQRAKLRAALPQETGGGTDIGSALGAAVQELQSGSASDIQRVVFITDGVNQPPPGAPFPADINQGEWPSLIQQGAALQDIHGDRLKAFGWAPPGSGPTDVALVQKVFPDAEVLALPNEQFSQFMAEQATEVQRERVRPAVTQDLATPVLSAFDTDSSLSAEKSATLTLTNPRVGMPTQVDLKGISVTEADGTPVPASVAPAQITLAPGESQTFDVALQPANTDHGFTLGEQPDTREWTVAVDAATSLSPELTELLKNQKLAAPENTVGAVAQPTPQPITVSAMYGLAWWKFFAIVGALFAALIALALFLRWWFVAPRLVDQLVDGDGNLLLSLRGREVKLPQAAVPAPNTDDAVRLFSKPRSHAVWIERLAGEPQRRGEPLTVRAKKLTDGDEITLGKTTVYFQRRKTGKK